jgi:RimJ/RimL family protein N-acetyltransferase
MTAVSKIQFVKPKKRKIMPIFTHTKRLTIRAFLEADLNAFVAMRSDLEVARYQSWSSFGLAEGYVFIIDLQQAKPGEPDSWYQFAVALRESDELIGDCALFTSEDGRFGELGYTFARAYQGQGYATEAVTAVLDYTFAKLGLQQITAITDGRNAPSIALLNRLGFLLDRRETAWFKGEWAEEYYFVMSKQAWQQRGNK